MQRPHYDRLRSLMPGQSPICSGSRMTWCVKGSGVPQGDTLLLPSLKDIGDRLNEAFKCENSIESPPDWTVKLLEHLAAQTKRETDEWEACSDELDILWTGGESYSPTKKRSSSPTVPSLLTLGQNPESCTPKKQASLKRKPNDSDPSTRRFPLAPSDHQAQALYPYQKAGVEFAFRKKARVIIGDEMGLGKTAQALFASWGLRSWKQSLSSTAALGNKFAKRPPGAWPVLVVCPSSLRFVWKNEISYWLDCCAKSEWDRNINVQLVLKGSDPVDPKADFVVISYSLLGLQEKYQHRADGGNWGTVICDEAHYIKDPTAKRSRAVVAIAHKAKHCILTTGTPALNKAVETFTLLNMVLPSETLPSYNRFAERYAWKETKKFGSRHVVAYTGAKRPSELHYILSHVMIRRLKKEVLTDLPDKTRMRLPLGREELDKKLLKEIGSLMKVTENESMESGGGNITKLFDLTGESKIPAVAKYVEELLESSGEVEENSSK